MASSNEVEKELANLNVTGDSIKVRCLVQQCRRAKLQTVIEDKEKGVDAQFVEVTISIFILFG